MIKGDNNFLRKRDLTLNFLMELSPYYNDKVHPFFCLVQFPFSQYCTEINEVSFEKTSLKVVLYHFLQKLLCKENCRNNNMFLSSCSLKAFEKFQGN